MSSWEIWTWLAAAILGPGAVTVLVLFLRGARRMLRQLEKEGSED